MDSLPNRPLSAAEIEELCNNDIINNAEPLYYQEPNSIICMLINIDSTAHVLVFNHREDTWEVFSSVGAESSTKQYEKESDTIIDYVDDLYEEHGYSVYGVE